MVCHVPMHHTRHAALMPAATNRSTGKTVYSEIGLLFDLLSKINRGTASSIAAWYFLHITLTDNQPSCYSHQRSSIT